MKPVICIVCPNSCHLEVDEVTRQVKGHQCPRGESYGLQEITNPKRTLTTSVRTIYPDQPLCSVRTRGEVPKSSLKEIMSQIRDIVIDKPLAIGAVIIENVASSGSDIILTSDIRQGASNE